MYTAIKKTNAPAPIRNDLNGGGSGQLCGIGRDSAAAETVLVSHHVQPLRHHEDAG